MLVGDVSGSVLLGAREGVPNTTPTTPLSNQTTTATEVAGTGCIVRAMTDVD